MDTHKDFIHIDEVFRDLRNGEEKEPSGAWLRMKDLLDKEMPAGGPVSAGKSFRRYIIPLVALLLVGGGFAYYKVNQDSKTMDVLLASSGKMAPTHKPGQDQTSHLASGNVPDTKEKTTLQPTTGAKNNAYTNRRKDLQKNIQGAGHNGKNKTVHAVAAAGSHNTRILHAPVEKGHATPGKPDLGGKSSSALAAKATLRNPAAMQNQLPVVPSRVIEEQRVIEQIKPRPVAVSNENGQLPPATATGNNTATAAKLKNRTEHTDPVFNNGPNTKQIAATLNNKKIVQASDGNMYKEERDTFKRIDLVSRTFASNTNGNRKYKTVLDTVAVTRIEKVSYVPLTVLEIVALRKVKVAQNRNGEALVPMASLRERIESRETVNLVPLAKYKVASRRVDPGKFNQLVQNTTQGISNYFDGSRNFYMAVMAGGNASFGNPGAFGLQLGIAGLYQLSERLTFAAELKYANHYFSNYSLEDKSVTFENVSSQQLSGLEWLFSGMQKTTTSSYRINSYEALEMPVTLNYNLGRVSIFGGLNMAYAFPVKWRKENTINTADVKQTRDQNENPFLNTGFTIDEQKDFSSRFGIGYVWGLNYDLSRKVSLDARMTQILWDNNKGNTDAIRKLFHVPTLQVSFGYYFGRKDKVVYIMDKR